MTLRLPLAILAAYRLALILTEEDGPLFAFARLRDFTDRCRATEQEQGSERGPWASLDDGLRCTWCVGIWAAALCALLMTCPTRAGDVVLTWLGVAGGQLVLERWQE